MVGFTVHNNSHIFAKHTNVVYEMISKKEVTVSNSEGEARQEKEVWHLHGSQQGFPSWYNLW